MHFCHLLTNIPETWGRNRSFHLILAKGIKRKECLVFWTFLRFVFCALTHLTSIGLKSSVEACTTHTSLDKVLLSIFIDFMGNNTAQQLSHTLLPTLNCFLSISYKQHHTCVTSVAGFFYLMLSRLILAVTSNCTLIPFMAQHVTLYYRHVSFTTVS